MKKQNIIDAVASIEIQMEKAVTMADEIREGFLDGVMPNWTDPKEREDHSYKLLLSFERYSTFTNIMLDYMNGTQKNIAELLESLESEEIEPDEVKKPDTMMELRKIFGNAGVNKADLDKSAVTTTVKQRLGDLHTFLNDFLMDNKHDTDFNCDMGRIFESVEELVEDLNKLDEVAV